MTTWDGPTLTLIIAQLFGGLVTVIGAIFAGLAMLRAGRASAKVEQVGGTVAAIEVNTNSRMTRLTEQNKMLSDKLEQLVLSQLATLTAERQVALTKVQTLEAEVVKRADAAPALTQVEGPAAALDAINETIEHERRNRNAASASIQVAMAELNKRLDALGPDPAHLDAEKI